MAATDRFVMPFTQWVDGNSRMLAGGKLYFYLTGTDTAQDTYSDATLETENANPVVADSDGVWGDIYLSPFVEYKVVLKDTNDVTLQTADPVSSPALNASELIPQMFGVSPYRGLSPDSSPDCTAGLTAMFAAADTLKVPVRLPWGIYRLASALPEPICNHYLQLHWEPGAQLYADYNEADNDRGVLAFVTYAAVMSGFMTISKKTGRTGGVALSFIITTDTVNVGAMIIDSGWLTATNFYTPPGWTYPTSVYLDGTANDTAALGFRDFFADQLLIFGNGIFKGTRLTQIANGIVGGNLDLRGTVAVPTDGFKMGGLVGGDVYFAETRRSVVDADVLGNVYNTKADAANQYNSGTTYASGASVLSNYLYYTSLQNGNLNKTPVSEPSWWSPDLTKNRGSLFCEVRGRVAGVEESNWLTQRYTLDGTSLGTGEWLGPQTDEFGNKSYSHTTKQTAYRVARSVDANGWNGWELYSDNSMKRWIGAATAGGGKIEIDVNDTAENNLAGPSFVAFDYPIIVSNKHALGENAPDNQHWDVQANWKVSDPVDVADFGKVECVAKLMTEPVWGSNVINLVSLSFTITVWGTAG